MNENSTMERTSRAYPPENFYTSNVVTTLPKKIQAIYNLQKLEENRRYRTKHQFPTKIQIKFS